MTDFKLLLLQGMKTTRFSKEDRTTSSRSKIKVGHCGFACRYCHFHKTFPMNIPSITKHTFPNFFNHFKRDCPKIPEGIRQAIIAYRSINKEQLDEFEYNSQGDLSERIWKKLRA